RLGHQLTSHMPGLPKVPYLRAANIGDGELLLDDVKRMWLRPDDVKDLMLITGDVVVSEASGSSAQVGKAALWNGSIPDCCFQNTVIRLRCRNGVAPEYIVEYLRYSRLSGKLASMARGVGIQHLAVSRLSKLEIALPPTSEQRRIVDRLNRARRLSQGTKARALSGADLLDKELSSALESLTVSTDVTTELRNVCLLHNGRAFRTAEWGATGLPIIRIQNLRDPSAPFNYYDGSVAENNRVRAGDLLFAWSGTPGTSFGPHIWNGPEAALNQHIYKVEVTDSNVAKEFLYWALRALLPRFVDSARGGAGLQHLRKSDILLEAIPVIGPDKQLEWVTRLGRAQRAADHARRLAQSISSRADDLMIRAMQRAFTGQLNTSDENDLPLILPAAARRAPRERGNRHGLPIERNAILLDTVILSVLESAQRPLNAPELFESVQARCEIGAVEFNHVLLDLVYSGKIELQRENGGTTYRSLLCA
ncbi:MAG TPA: restriction endonuclease subunit S, partial [Verrucomicrobiae bacterium]|nr:restriction endonuclease subunit S [Verrucomicrobiae bacterium]